MRIGIELGAVRFHVAICKFRDVNLYRLLSVNIGISVVQEAGCWCVCVGSTVCDVCDGHTERQVHLQSFDSDLIYYGLQVVQLDVDAQGQGVDAQLVDLRDAVVNVG